jgi:hypothetical protein
MKKIIADILSGMEGAVAGIRLLAEEHESKGDSGDAGAVLQHLANTSLAVDAYGILYAHSAVIETGAALVAKYGDRTAKADAKEMARWDYNA